MKDIYAGFITLTLVAAAPVVSVADTFFSDNFSNGSTLNGSSVPGGTAAASCTSYDIASTKDALSQSSIGPGLLRLKLAAGTASGFWESQALFTTNAVGLFSGGDYIELEIVFTNAAGTNGNGADNTIMAGSSSSSLWIGLFNSGGNPTSLNPPVAGDLANAGLGKTSSYATGHCASWTGYAAQIYSNAAPKIVTRPAQTGSTSADQDLLGNNTGSGTYDSPKGTNLSVGTQQGIFLVPENQYTVTLRLTLDTAGGITISNALFNGVGTTGSVVFSQSTLSTNNIMANAYDGFAFGALNKAGSINPQMDVTSITITGHSTLIVPQPLFASVQSSNQQLSLTVAVADSIGWLTLESRTNAQTGAWVAEQTQSISNNQTATFQVDSSKPMEFFRARGRTRSASPTFFGQVEAGLSLIRASYPNAQLYFVQATNPVPANSPDIAWLTIVCIVDQYADAVSIASTNAYAFGPVHSLGKLVGGGLVPWPVAMDITEADTALKQAGYSGTYNYVVLRQPLYPGMDEPYYAFSMTAGPGVYVGVNDGKISAGY